MYRAVLALAVTSLVAAPPALRAQEVEGQSYFFTLRSSGDTPITGVMHVAGDGRARIDMREEDEAEAPQYLLLSPDGRTVTVVRPKERTYSVMDAEKFERIVGTAIRAVDAVLTLEVADLEVRTERLGEGETVAGLPTERHRLVQDFTMRIGVLGHTAAEHHHVVTEYWVNPELRIPRNPLVELVLSAQTALAQSNEKFVEQSRRLRESLPKTAPLRVVVVAQQTDEDGSRSSETHTYEVTRAANAVIDARALEVPEGFRRSSDDRFDFRL